MKVFATRHFSSALQRARTPPDGTSLEEKMNVFLATMPMRDVVDIEVSVTSNNPPLYCGVVIYATEAP